MVKTLFVGVLLSAASANPSDWTQWRGPNRDGASDVGRTPNAWPSELTQRWRSQVGAGQSSPVVLGGTVFLFSREEEMEVVRAIDLRTGKTLWRQGYSAPYRVYSGAASYGSGPKSTPVAYQERIFTFVTPCDQNIVTPLVAGDLVVVSSVGSGTQGIRPTRHSSGWVAQVAWHTQEVSMYMSSPILVNGRVVGLSHRKKGQYFALDAATGKVHWVSEPARGENAAFVLAQGALLVLEGDGTLLVLPDAASFAPTHRYRVGESATFAHPVPTELGLLVKDENGLALYSRESSTRTGLLP